MLRTSVVASDGRCYHVEMQIVGHRVGITSLRAGASDESRSLDGMLIVRATD